MHCNVTLIFTVMLGHHAIYINIIDREKSSLPNFAGHSKRSAYIITLENYRKTMTFFGGKKNSIINNKTFTVIVSPS